MTRSDLAAGYELAYSEARRALDDQERVATDLRGRAAVLIAAAAVVTSFFGSAIGDRGLPWTGWVAVSCFVLVCGAVLVVIWPRRHARPDPATIVEDYLEAPGDGVSLIEIHRDLLVAIGRSSSNNSNELAMLTRCLRGATAMLAGETVAWIATAAGWV